MYYICNINIKDMETITAKKNTTFRLSESLLVKLRIAAMNEHRSLNNYVECILMSAADKIPNETTIKAIKEARSGKYAGTIDTSSIEAMIKSCE